MRLGWLRPNSPAPGDVQAEGIPRALADAGWVEGRNLAIERRWGRGTPEALDASARELVDARCDAILAVGASAARAARQATATIPVVMFGNFDPVARGLIGSLARPGGNLTGVLIAPDGTLASKRLELLKEAVPGATRIGLLAADDPEFKSQVTESRAAAAALGLALPVATSRGGDHAKAFATLMNDGVQAMLIGAHTQFMSERKPIIELAARHRMPTCWEWPEQVRDGGLMAYGTNLHDLYRRLASYVDRVLKGARAADLPIERPSKFELVINRRTANAIGLAIPRQLLLRADAVIE